MPLNFEKLSIFTLILISNFSKSLFTYRYSMFFSGARLRYITRSGYRFASRPMRLRNLYNKYINTAPLAAFPRTVTDTLAYLSSETMARISCSSVAARLGSPSSDRVANNTSASRGLAINLCSVILFILSYGNSTEKAITTR